VLTLEGWHSSYSLHGIWTCPDSFTLVCTYLSCVGHIYRKPLEQCNIHCFTQQNHFKEWLHNIDTFESHHCLLECKVVFLKPWGFGICEMFPNCGSHESQSLTVFRKTTLRCLHTWLLLNGSVMCKNGELVVGIGWFRMWVQGAV
jgi:hypothetical protein